MDPGKLVAFVLLIIGGHICLPLLVLTFALSRSVTRRSLTLINLLLSIIVYATSLLLLFYAGQGDNPSPSFILCRFQSALFHGSAPMIATAGLSLVLETAELVFSPQNRRSYAKLAALLGMPWAVLIGFFVAFFYTGLQISPETELFLNEEPFFYCRFPRGVLVTTSDAVTAIALVLIILLEGIVLFRLFRLARRFKVQGERFTVPLLHLLLRGLIFTIFTSAELSAFSVYDTYTAGAGSFIAFSLPPLGTFLIFGTQPDVLNTWFCCGKKRETWSKTTTAASTKISTAKFSPSSSKISVSTSGENSADSSV